MHPEFVQQLVLGVDDWVGRAPGESAILGRPRGARGGHQKHLRRVHVEAASTRSQAARFRLTILNCLCANAPVEGLRPEREGVSKVLYRSVGCRGQV